MWSHGYILNHVARPVRQRDVREFSDASKEEGRTSNEHNAKETAN